ncbi:MAG: type II toxin-antitoxin system VapC family toxin [Betaproteobacteria bacterium]|nr:type II toxin-antitoxin system VapC family toxin [Betaproteobacteria bacterium]
MNAFLGLWRGKQISEEVFAKCIESLNHLGVELDMHPAGVPAMVLARKHNLNFYDAMYLELAKRLSAPLATLDKALIRAAKAEGVVLVYQKK